MCDPVTIMAVTTVAATGMSAYQSIEQGKYQNDIAKYNASVTKNEATETRNKGTEAENEQRRQTAELLSKQRAQLGASNVDLSSGSALQLQADTETLGEADALRIRSNYDSTYDSLQSQAALTLNQGSNAESAGKTAAYGSILGGTSKILGSGVADSWFSSDSAGKE